jgi:cytochrome c biogenesis protein CcdA
MILHWEHRTRLCSWNYIRNSGNGYVHGITLGTVETKCVHGITLGTVGTKSVHGIALGTMETAVFMVLHWEQWKRLCSWYYIANSGNICVHGTTLVTVGTKSVHGITFGTVETVMFMVLYCEQWKRLCSWYYIGNSGNGYVHGTMLRTVETYVFMELHWEQWKRNLFMVLHSERWKRLYSWYYIRNGGNGYVHGTTLGTVETKCVHGITLGTVETGVLMVLHWEPWKRLCSRNYIRNSGNDCAHLTTLGTVETIVLMELHSEQFSETMVFMVLHLRTAETIVFIVLRWERRKYP